MSDTMSKKQFIISGIGTDVGKTVASAIISQALNATYWKPVQAGDLDWSDSMKVDNWTDDKVIVLKEQFRLTAPMSPHAAAFLDGVSITQDSFVIPQVEGNLIIEGAGGLMVPLNDEGLCYLDVFQHWDLPVYVITRHYLGSINHTLLTLNALYCREIRIAGLIVNGNRNEASERIYRNHFPELHLSYIPELENFTPETVKAAAQQWKDQVL